MYEVYDRLKKRFTNLDLKISGFRAEVYIGENCVFSTRGSEWKTHVEAYLMGIEHGIVIGEQLNK